jgi:hypothetical protein
MLTQTTRILPEIITDRVQSFILQGDLMGTDLRQLEDELDMQLELLENKQNVASGTSGAATASRVQKGIDIYRVLACASSFGQCSVDEIKLWKDGTFP